MDFSKLNDLQTQFIAEFERILNSVRSDVNQVQTAKQVAIDALGSCTNSVVSIAAAVLEPPVETPAPPAPPVVNTVTPPVAPVTPNTDENTETSDNTDA
jgi:aconitase A